MAKRANPYSEDFIQQSKIYVNLKQFNNNEDKLKKVYEKTLQMLFQGAKNYQNNNLLNEANGIALEKKDKMKQLFIDKNGSLSHSGTLVDTGACERCDCGSVGAQSCDYCERSLCALCARPCALCERSYCTKCSIIGSEGVEICVSCYT